MNFINPKTTNKNLKHLAIAFLVFASLLMVSCGKDSSVTPDPGSNTSKFKAADFKISNIVTEEISYGLSIDYEEMNVTSMNYNYDNDGAFRIKWTVKTTDGVQYQEDRLLATELDAGGAAALSCVISVTEGKTIDVSTLTYEVYYNH